MAAFVPVLRSIVQSLPLTSTQESPSVMPDPSNVLARSTPPVVPSLMSTDSAVVAAIVLPSTVLRSLRSGAQPLMSHQLLRAVPT